MTSSNSICNKKFYIAATLDGEYPRFSPSGLKKISETCNIPRPLLLTVMDPAEQRQIPLCTALCLELTPPSRIIPHLFTFKEYMEYALYDPDFGYYTTRPGIGSDFYTTPMKNSPHYGACLAELVFRQWQGMVDAGSFEKNERFDVLELGAGTGVLARDFVQHVKIQSGMDPLWRIFHENLQYITGEISPDLQAKQRATTEQFSDKVKVVPADARQLSDAFGKNSLQGMIISNELPDAFSCHKVMKTEHGALLVAVAVPVIKMFDHFVRGFPEFLSETERDQLLKLMPKVFRMNNLLHGYLKPSKGFIQSATTPEPIDENTGYLTKELYKEIRKLDLPFFEMRVTWKEFWVSADYFPEVAVMQRAHRDLFRTLDPLKPVPFNSDLRPFQQGCGEILTKGAQLITDYMYDNYEMKRWADGFRTYPSTQIHDYRTPPGEEDITSDVNASALAVEGIRAGFTTDLFCSEREFLSQLPDRYPHLKIRSKGLPFHVLMMHKNGTASTYQPHVLTRPVTYRELFLKFSDWTCTAIPRMRYIKEKTTLVARSILILLRQSEEKKPEFNELTIITAKILAAADAKNPLLEKAVHALLMRAIFFNPNLLTIAKEYPNVTLFDYKRIRNYFIARTNSDQVERLMIQLVHQILHLHYTS